VSVAPIHSGLDGGMNGVFLAQVGGSIPPARVPSGSRPPQPPDNNGSLASKLFSLLGWKPASQTQVASTDSATQERGADLAATGSTVTPKAKPAPQIETVAGAKPKSSEPPKIESAKNDSPEPQQTAAAQPKPVPQQEANAAPPGDNTGSAPPTAPADSFDGRWSGLPKSESGVEFKFRWALGSR
jgi:hypothetical protein